MSEETASSASQQPEKFGVGRLFWLTQDAIVAADLSTERIILWNPAATKIFGYSESEVLGMQLDRLVPIDLHEAHHGGIRRYRETGEAHLVGGDPVEVPSVTKDGNRIYVSLTLTALPEPGGPFVLAIIRDISEQRAAQEQLTNMNEAMQSFVATASHDLRTPLTSIVGFAKLLSERSERLTGEQQKEFSASILRAGERAVRLIDDLLTLSKLQAERVEVRGQIVSVAGAAQEAIADAGIDVLLSIPVELQVRVDLDHFHRILVNYLTNASRYGEPPVEIRASANKDLVEIRVCDEGNGVPEEFRTKLFTAFARARASEGVQGTGLGLAIVKGLAEANAGEAFYEPREKGSCFGVRLPSAR